MGKRTDTATRLMGQRPPRREAKAPVLPALSIAASETNGEAFAHAETMQSVASHS
jgi:hypothetical protein